MTPDERAEKIIRDWKPQLPVFKANPSLGPIPDGSLKGHIAAAIRAAVEEAKAEDYAAGAIEQQKRCHAHVANAYEDAAKIADELAILKRANATLMQRAGTPYWDLHEKFAEQAEHSAAAIRARASEVSK